MVKMNKEIEILNEANFCIHCLAKPCQEGCPLNNDTEGFIDLIREKKYKDAYDLLLETTVLPSVCGRICPHENQCEGKCVKKIASRSVKIGMLEAFIGDQAIENNWSIKSNIVDKDKKVAVVGGGPSGLSCAAFLRKKGYKVTIFEKYNSLGGLLSYGIPDFRLDKNILKQTINNILNMGIEVKYNKCLGIDFTLDDLKNNYDAIFLGIGTNISKKLNISGENLNGVYGGNELLEHKNYPDFNNKKVVIYGCGNVAMDLSRTIIRMNASEVYVIYRRDENNAPALKSEIENAKSEGVKFIFLSSIVAIKGTDKVESIELIKNELVNDDDNVVIKSIINSNYEINCDYVIKAIGSMPNLDLVNSLNLDLLDNGKIKINNFQTSDEKVFAGGDVAGIKSTVAFAAKSGVDAAERISKYLEGKN